MKSIACIDCHDPKTIELTMRHDLDVPVWEVICGGLAGTPLLYTPPTEEMRERSRLLGRDMGLGDIGLNLYNNGFSGGFVAATLVPIFESIRRPCSFRWG